MSFFPPVVLPVSPLPLPLPNPIPHHNLYILTPPTLIYRRDQYSKTKRIHTRGRNLNRRIGWSIRTSLYKPIRLTTEEDDASKPTAQAAHVTALLCSEVTWSTTPTSARSRAWSKAADCRSAIPLFKSRRADFSLY